MYWREWGEYKHTKGRIYHEWGCKKKSCPSYTGSHLIPNDKFLVGSSRYYLIPVSDPDRWDRWTMLNHNVWTPQLSLHSLLQEVISSKLTSKTHLDITTNNVIYLTTAFHVLSIHYIILLSSGKIIIAFDILLVLICLIGHSHYGNLVVNLRSIYLFVYTRVGVWWYENRD